MDSKEVIENLRLRPIGFVKNTLRDPLPMPKGGAVTEEYLKVLREYHKRIKEQESELVISPELEGILEGIEEFSHIWVLYWAHLVPEDRKRTMKVHPMGRADMPQKGVFATCSPARPNPILLCPVRLIKRKKNILVVKGLDALNSSPILDIKPYVADYHCVPDAFMPEWMKRLRKEMKDSYTDEGEKRGSEDGEMSSKISTHG